MDGRPPRLLSGHGLSTLARWLPEWWTHRLFAAAAADEAPAGWRASPLLHVAALVLLAGLLFGSRLRAPLLEPQEVRYAEIPRQMLAAGDWLVPTLHGEPYLDKPPLLYWAVMASYTTFGVRDSSARLVPAAAGICLVVIAYWWGRRLFGPATALCGAAVLGLTPEFVYRGRMLTFDVVLAAWVTAALACGHVACLGGRRRAGWWAASAVACGLGLLTKGPVALVLVAVPLAAATWLDRRLARPTLWAWAGYLAVAGMVAAPWYVAVMVRQPEFAGTFFWKHNVVRFVQPFDHARPAWYYLPGLLLGLLPWTLLLPGLARFVTHRDEAPRRPGELGFLLIASLWMLLFFSAAGCKRPTYLLPALPPLALALGWYVHRGLAAWERATALAAAGAAVCLLAGAGLPLLGLATAVVRPEVAVGLAGGSAAVAVALAARRRLVGWATTAGLTFAGLWLGIAFLLPAYHDRFSLRGHLRQQASISALGTRPVVCYPQRYDSAHFYLPGRPVRVFAAEQRRELCAYLAEHPGTLLLVKSGPVFRDLLAALPPAVEFRTGQRGGAILVGRVMTRDRPPVQVAPLSGAPL